MAALAFPDALGRAQGDEGYPRQVCPRSRAWLLQESSFLGLQGQGVSPRKNDIGVRLHLGRTRSSWRESPMLAALIALLAVADATNPELISVEVGLVRVTPFRPGTQTPWAIPGRPAQSDPCALLVPAAVATGAA